MSKSPTSTLAPKSGDTKLHNTLVYIRQHWQLYVFFIMPAFLLTIIFRYIPMGGIAIAFTNYNPIIGIFGSEFVAFQHFERFLSSPDFLEYLANTLKLSVFGLLWGFPIPILLAFLLGFPANEIVVPILIMTYLSTGTLQDMGDLDALRTLLCDHGWTWLTAVCTMLFSLFHWPCSTTCLTIYKETGSVKWTVLSVLLPTALGLGLCLCLTAAARLLGIA